MKKLSLRPYHGNLYVCSSTEDYQKAHKRIFGSRDVTIENGGTAGRFGAGCGADGLWAYLVWYSSPGVLAHELSHVLFHVFDRCGMDPRDSGGEAFCYMLSQLMLEALE